MNRLVSLVILGVGIALIVYGIQANNSIGSSFSRFFTGSPTDKSMWMLLGGIVLSAVGLGGMLVGSKSV